MIKVLVSAFEPFGGLKQNSSLLVQQRLKSIYKNIEISKVVLPVLYNTAFEKLLLKIEQEKPDI
ncbi:MAG: pyroglutamyl-peptidase I, partial [Clostridiales bacterium]|nr:pyroglutamyl-peptidase I [Clostridiales bacterium]